MLRHRWLDLLRARERRQDRERASAADELWPSPLDVVEKAAVQRELVGAVLELDEPYRTTVLLRFFEELPQREIARRMQTSSATVNSRLQRALAKLRERLSRGGGPAAWLRVLVPLLREPGAAPAAALGAVVMKVALTCVVVVASLIAGFVPWSSDEEAPLAAAPASLPAAAAPAEPAEGRASAPAAVQPQRELAGGRNPVALDAPRPAPAPSAPEVKTVRGRVLDASGRALSGIALVLCAPDSKATSTSDPRGEFEIPLDVPAESIVVADPGFATVLAGSARVHDSTLTTVVVAPRIELAGVVIDAAGAPLADAALELRMPAGFGAEVGRGAGLLAAAALARAQRTRRTLRARRGPGRRGRAGPRGAGRLRAGDPASAAAHDVRAGARPRAAERVLRARARHRARSARIARGEGARLGGRRDRAHGRARRVHARRAPRGDGRAAGRAPARAPARGLRARAGSGRRGPVAGGGRAAARRSRANARRPRGRRGR